MRHIQRLKVQAVAVTYMHYTYMTSDLLKGRNRENTHHAALKDVRIKENITFRPTCVNHCI